MDKSDKNISIHAKLEKHKKSYLQSYADYLKIKGTSKLKKDELIDAIVIEKIKNS